MQRRQFLIGVGAAVMAAGCGGSPTTPGGVNNPPPPPPDPPPPPPPPTPPTSRITRILAFGDSMTAGTTSPAVMLRALDAGPSQSYPYKLQALMTARYTAQTLSVFNTGVPGEFAHDARGRLASRIREASPELLLLMEGANDLNNIVGSLNAGIDSTVAALEDMVRDTLGRNIPVFLATLPPQRGRASDLLPRYNDGLRSMAAKKGATLVDINAMLDLSYIGRDGLHPTELGYDRIAEFFLNAIKEKYEVAPALRAR